MQVMQGRRMETILSSRLNQAAAVDAPAERMLDRRIIGGALLRSIVMRFFSTTVLRVFGVLTCSVAALIFGSHWIHALVVPVFPLILPGMFMFGYEWEP